MDIIKNSIFLSLFLYNNDKLFKESYNLAFDIIIIYDVILFIKSKLRKEHKNLFNIDKVVCK